MLSTRIRLQNALDRTIAVAIGSLLVGTTLAFGGAVWWAPAAISVLAGVIVLAWIARAAMSGSWQILKSPLTALGTLALGIAALQLAPMPARVAELVSPGVRAVHSQGVIPRLARLDDPDVVLPEPAPGPTPLTVDRPATLRWLAGGLTCLALFWVVSHYADRLGRLYLIWGSVVAGFLLNTAIVVVQLIGGVDGLYGFIEPGVGPRWAPTAADALDAPGETAFRVVADTTPTAHTWALGRPGRPATFGTMQGGPGAYLAIASLGLPLALAVTLQLMAPRGSREGLWARLAESGQGSLLATLYPATVVAAGLVGLFAGPRLVIPYALAVGLVGLPCLLGTGLKWKGLLLTGATLGALAGGVWLGGHWAEFAPTGKGSPRVDFDESPGVWSDAMPIFKDFPILGTGLGSFATIQPYYKTRDAGSTTARSSLLGWGVESGFVGLGLVALAVLWGLTRLPGALLRVGSADRALAAGMVGAVACFALISTIHWTVDLAAVALAATAVAGTCNRWLAGGTDLFVERA